MDKSLRLSLSLCFVMLLSVICGLFLIILNNSAKDLSHKQNEKSIRMGAVYMTLNNPFYKIVDEEMRTQIENNGDILITRNPSLDADLQNEEILDLIKNDVKLIFVNPVDADKIAPALEAAQKAHIPVIAIDTNVANEKLVKCTIVSDNYLAGQQCAEHLLKTMPDGANIGLLTHAAAQSAVNRIDGFKNVLKNNPNFNIVEESDCLGQLELAMPATEEMLTRHPEINVIMALNDPAALGAMAALTNKGMLSKTMVYGVDGSPEAKDMIKNNMMTATAAQLPRKIGQLAVAQAYKILHGETIETSTKLPTILLTHDDMSHFQEVGY